MPTQYIRFRMHLVYYYYNDAIPENYPCLNAECLTILVAKLKHMLKICFSTTNINATILSLWRIGNNIHTVLSCNKLIRQLR